MTSHNKQEVNAQRVYDALKASGARGLTLLEIIHQAKLTRYQVRRGMGYMRESLADLKGSGSVYSYDPRTHRYCLEYIPEQVEAYELMRIRGESMRTYRMLTGTAIPHAQLSRAKQIRMLRRHLLLVVEDANDILAPT